MKLSGKVALITGASRGIGKAIAKVLNENGATVYLVARDAEKLSVVTHEIDPTGDTAFSCVCDITSETSIYEMFKRFKADNISFDILVNAAGIAKSSAIENLSLEQWDQVLDTNITAQMVLAKHCFEDMKEKGGGKIINIASILGTVASPGMSAYSASKGAVIMFTKTLAVELSKYNIQANAIAPGYINTDMTKKMMSDKELSQRLVARTPAGRLGDPEDVAKVALFLATEDSNYVTGAVIPVDGGMSVALMQKVKI